LAVRGGLRVRPFPGDELPVPPENSVRSHDRGNLREQPATETRAAGSQASSFVVGEPQTPGTELRLQDAVLLVQVRHDLVLLASEPTDERRDEQVQRNHVESTSAASEIVGHYGLVLCVFRRNRRNRTEVRKP
jgi:hypothetical protein